MSDLIEQQREHFENISEKYYNARKSTNHLYLKELMWRFFFKNKTQLKDNQLSVLEPMCGYSEGKSILERNIGVLGSYEGFDYSSVLVEKVKEMNPDLNVYVQDVSTFKSDKKFDVIIIIGGLHHVPSMCEEVVQNLRNNLKSQGAFIVLEPTHNNIIFRKIRERIYNKNTLFDQETEKAFRLKELNNLFLNNGYKLADQMYPGLLSYILFYNPDAFPFLNIGGKGLVKLAFKIDSFFFRNYIGRKLSFATLSMFTID
ncbi:methyltransferase domain-containing protein [Aquimarina gracilis]|uniref:Methyltransferase domain-containing protein n=1 Tax=Aquimarina gracilis TaxID=874422 RepID=A0ABU5ZXX4_9FLAO|nr:methyltransferase domain-containing protein [Aquimarina gracilis]MEB3346748.1 methyltransferase domain-containing protein [Aquimarina gracilis]